MRECLLCGQLFLPELNLAELFVFKGKRKENLCPHCWAKFEKLSATRCMVCSKNLSEAGICQDCKIWQKQYDQQLLHHHSLYRYNQEFHDLMVQYKRYGDYMLYGVLRELCSKQLMKMDYDFYIPIPSSPEHLKKRGFDTITAVYQELVPLTPLLKKLSGSSAQGEKNKAERLNTPQMFYVDTTYRNQHHIEIHKNNKILLLDDIYTTGRTLYHARDSLLLENPNVTIESFSICR